MRESRRDPLAYAYLSILFGSLAALSYIDVLKKRRVTKLTLKRAIRR